MTSVLITPPINEPISLAEAKLHLRVDHNDEDTLIASLMIAARSHIELLCQRKMITQSWRIYKDQWPRNHILPIYHTPLQSVETITVYDEEGNPHILDNSDYDTDSVSTPARIYLKSANWLGKRRLNGFEIDVVVGYGDNASDIPAALKQAILLLMANWYEHRSAGIDPQMQYEPVEVMRLVAPYREVRL